MYLPAGRLVSCVWMVLLLMGLGCILICAFVPLILILETEVTVCFWKAMENLSAAIVAATVGLTSKDKSVLFPMVVCFPVYLSLRMATTLLFVGLSHLNRKVYFVCL